MEILLTLFALGSFTKQFIDFHEYDDGKFTKLQQQKLKKKMNETGKSDGKNKKLIK